MKEIISQYYIYIISYIIIIALKFKINFSSFVYQLIIFEILYYTIHRLYHSGYKFLMPLHYLHHDETSTIFGIFTSDTLTILIYGLFLKTNFYLDNSIIIGFQ